MDTLTLFAEPLAPLLLVLSATAAVTYYATYWTRQREIDELHRDLAHDDATLRAQREEIDRLRAKVREYHRWLAGEEEAGRVRDAIIDAQRVDRAYLEVIEGGAR